MIGIGSKKCYFRVNLTPVISFCFIHETWICMKSFYDNFSPRPQDPQDTEYEGEYGGEYGGDYGEDYYYGESGNLQISVFVWFS